MKLYRRFFQKQILFDDKSTKELLTTFRYKLTFHFDTYIQSKVQECIALHERCKQLVEQLALFSSNETADDIATSELKYILPFPLCLQKIPPNRLLPGRTDRETLH